MKRKLISTALALSMLTGTAISMPAFAEDTAGTKVDLSTIVKNIDGEMAKYKKESFYQDFMEKALRNLPIKEYKTRVTVNEVLTDSGHFVIHDTEANQDMFSLKASNKKYSIHYVILSDGSILPADQTKSFETRAAFSTSTELDDQKITHIIFTVEGEKDLFIQKFNMKLNKTKVKNTGTWSYKEDGFSLSRELYGADVEDKKSSDRDDKNDGKGLVREGDRDGEIIVRKADK